MVRKRATSHHAMKGTLHLQLIWDKGDLTIESHGKTNDLRLSDPRVYK